MSTPSSAAHIASSPAVNLAARRGLSPDQIAAWHRDGYVAIPDFLSAAEVATLHAEVERLMAIGALRNVATDGDGVTTSTTVFNLQICPVTPISPVILDLIYSRRVCDSIIDLLGDQAIHHLDQIFLKPGGTGAGTNWHTDNAYFKSDLVEAGTGLWIAVHPASTANGTMTVIPGSHRREWAHQRDNGSDHHITCAATVGSDPGVAIDLPAGGALLFNYGVVHSTGPNRTDRARAGLALHFMDPRHATNDSWFTQQDAPARRIGPDSDGGLHRHGRMVRGAWEQRHG